MWWYGTFHAGAGIIAHRLPTGGTQRKIIHVNYTGQGHESIAKITSLCDHEDCRMTITSIPHLNLNAEGTLRSNAAINKRDQLGDTHSTFDISDKYV